MAEPPARSAASGSRDGEELWERLDRLLLRIEKGGAAGVGEGLVAGVRRGLLAPVARKAGVSSLDVEEIGELSRLYRAAATRLAQLQTFGASARRLERLNRLVARAHAAVYGRPPRHQVGRLFLRSFFVFPAVVRRTIAFHAAAALVIALGGLYGYHGAAADPEWALEFVSPFEGRTPFADRAELLESLLPGREGHAPVGAEVKFPFAAFLWTHNVEVALLCFFGGLLVGIPTLILAFYNGVFLGVYTFTFHSHGLAYEWWAWLLPHGVTELLAVTLLAGGGLYLGFQVLVPGMRSRAQALAAVRDASVHLVLFAFPMLLLAALVESFVRQSNLSDPGRYLFAAVSAIAWTLYLGMARPPESLLAAESRRPTLAEARVPLPDTDDLAGLRYPSRSRSSGIGSSRGVPAAPSRHRG